MRRHRTRRQAEHPSLVPLADMLTNTVGIMVFIFIFTVLAAGGVVIAKRLPFERTTKEKSIDFLCAGGRILALNSEPHIADFLKPLGRATSYEAVKDWLEKYNGHRLDTDGFTVSGEGNAFYTDTFFQKSATLNLAVVFNPKPGKGETDRDILRADSQFRQAVNAMRGREEFAHFFVRPDSVEVFIASRNLAAEIGIATGWWPLGLDKSPSYSVTGGGRAATTQSR